MWGGNLWGSQATGGAGMFHRRRDLREAAVIPPFTVPPIADPLLIAAWRAERMTGNMG